MSEEDIPEREEIPNPEEREIKAYLGTKIYASIYEYVGIVSGVSAGVSAFKNGFGLRETAVVLAGAVLYTIGKIINHGLDRLTLADKLSEIGLEKIASLECEDKGD